MLELLFLNKLAPHSYIILPSQNKLPTNSCIILPPLAAQLLAHFTASEQITNSYNKMGGF